MLVGVGLVPLKYTLLQPECGVMEQFRVSRNPPEPLQPTPFNLLGLDNQDYHSLGRVKFKNVVQLHACPNGRKNLVAQHAESAAQCGMYALAAVAEVLFR